VGGNGRGASGFPEIKSAVVIQICRYGIPTNISCNNSGATGLQITRGVASFIAGFYKGFRAVKLPKAEYLNAKVKIYGG
jgi:hypothetical protein